MAETTKGDNRMKNEGKVVSVTATSPSEIIRRYWPMLLAGLIFVAMQVELFSDWRRGWDKPYSYYSHGWLVPPIAAFMAWSNRKRISIAKVSPSLLGLILIVPAIPIFVFGRWTGSGVLCGATFMMFLIGAALLFLGCRMTRVLLFPMLFLIAMIPAPSTVLDNATLKVQLQSTTVAAKMLNVSGYSVSQQGAEIHSSDLPEPLIVGSPCSGFRLLISLLTFTAFFVYMLQAPGWKKVLLVFISFPLSLFINSLRIAMIGWAGIWTGSTEVMHKFHDWSGYIGLIVCFVILFGFAKLIKANVFGIPDPDPEQMAAAGQGTPSWKLIGSRGRGAMAIALFALVLASNIAIKPLEATAKGKLDLSTVPARFGDWTSTDLPVSAMVARELKTADLLQRLFSNYSLDGRQVFVFIEAAKDTDAFHDPHSCLPGGGEAITEDQLITLRFDKPRPMTVKATVLQSQGQFGRTTVIYWYMYGDLSCARTSEVRRKMRSLQLSQLSSMVFSPGERSRISREMDERQWYWYRFSTDAWEDEKSDIAFLTEFIEQFVANSRSFGE